MDFLVPECPIHGLRGRTQEVDPAPERVLGLVPPHELRVRDPPGRDLESPRRTLRILSFLLRHLPRHPAHSQVRDSFSFPTKMQKTLSSVQSPLHNQCVKFKPPLETERT